MRKYFRLFPFLFLTFALHNSVLAQPPAQLKILFIANSFVYNNNLPDIERKMANAAGINVVIDEEIELGQSINSHITDRACWRMIKSRKWDYIVIQDNQRFYYNTPPSLDSFGMTNGKSYPSPLLANNIKLQDSIKKLIPCVKIIYFEGWEQSGGIPSRFPGDNTIKLIGRIHDNYSYLNNRPGVHNIIAPVGDAFALSMIKRPYLDQASNKKVKSLFDRDGRHPTELGSYLAACVLFATIFHRSPIGVKPSYGKISMDYDTFFKRIAWQTVMADFRYTNLASVTPDIKHGFLNRYAFYTAKKYAAYQWYLGNWAIPGANKQKFKPGAKNFKPGYWVEAWDKKGCSYRSFPVEVVRGQESGIMGQEPVAGNPKARDSNQEPTAFAQIPSPASQEPVKILFIANSFVYNNNLPTMLRNLAQAAGISVDVKDEIELGQSINSHITNPKCWALIKSRKWDYVVIQDNQRFYYNTPPSLDSFGMANGKSYPSPLLANNIKLQDSIKKLIPCVKIIYFEGWEKSGGIPSRFPGDNTIKLISRIHDNYKYLNGQRDVHNVIAPIGDAFAASIAQRPGLERVSRNNIDFLFDHDLRHPGEAGSYLAACVLFVTLFHQSPVGLKPTYSLETRELDTFLKKIAWQTVMNNYAYANLGSITPVIRHGWLNKYALHTTKKYASYQWYNGNKAVKGAKGRIFKPKTKSQDYWVETTDKNGCWYRSFPYQE